MRVAGAEVSWRLGTKVRSPGVYLNLPEQLVARKAERRCQGYDPGFGTRADLLGLRQAGQVVYQLLGKRI